MIIVAIWFLAGLLLARGAEPGFWSARDVAEYLGRA
jgi:hypothetical protein